MNSQRVDYKMINKIFINQLTAQLVAYRCGGAKRK